MSCRYLDIFEANTFVSAAGYICDISAGYICGQLLTPNCWINMAPGKEGLLYVKLQTYMQMLNKINQTGF